VRASDRLGHSRERPILSALILEAVDKHSNTKFHPVILPFDPTPRGWQSLVLLCHHSVRLRRDRNLYRLGWCDPNVSDISQFFSTLLSAFRKAALRLRLESPGNPPDQIPLIIASAVLAKDLPEASSHLACSQSFKPSQLGSNSRTNDLTPYKMSLPKASDMLLAKRGV
jgi:hypothetical protein